MLEMLRLFSLVVAGLLTAAPTAQSKPTASPQAPSKQSVELNIDDAASFSEERAGLAVLVYRDGELVFERYQNGHKADTAQHIFSGTKSFAPMVALIAQRDGLLDLDEKVADTITEWRGDKHREQITIRQLLNFTSGLKNIDGALHSRRTSDKYAASVACDGVHEPGSRFRYGSNHLMVFGDLFGRKLRAASTEQSPLPKDVLGYLEQKILDPIGCRYEKWLRDNQGNPLLPYGAYLTARDWAKFGLLVLNHGKHGDEQVVPTEHFAECFTGTDANPTYGLNFWLVGKDEHKRNPRIPADTVTAAGMFNQRLYIIPSRQILVVRLGRTGARTRFDDASFLGALFDPKR